MMPPGVAEGPMLPYFRVIRESFGKSSQVPAGRTPNCLRNPAVQAFRSMLAGIDLVLLA